MARPIPSPTFGAGTLDDLTVCGGATTPPASQALLMDADRAVLEAIFAPYAGCGHMVDGNMTGRTQIQVSVSLPPGSRYMRAHITRCGKQDSGLGAQTASLVGGTTAGTPSTIEAASPLYGTELYLGTGATIGSTAIVTTGTAEIASPDPSRAIQVTEAAASAVEMIEVNTVAGFCLEVISRTGDIETL